MEIRYDSKKQAFIIVLDPLEHMTYVQTSNLVEARQMFIEHMTGIFDATVRKKFEDKGVVIHT